MTSSDPQLRQTLEYQTAALSVRLLPTGLLLVFAGLALAVLADADRRTSTTSVWAVVALATGVAVTVFALWRRAHPGKPYFTLSPAGVRYRISGVKEFLIPWREVRGVESIEIATQTPWYFWLIAPRFFIMPVLRDVTVVLVSNAFYQAHIHVDSFVLRGPSWEANFIAKGDLVQVALHHELASVAAKPLRDAVESRWRAFRDAPAAQTTAVVAMGARRPATRWEMAQIAALLVGVGAALANLAGLWELPGQSEARAVREKAREESDYWTAAAKRYKQESREREAQEKKRQREFDETMKRAFGE